METARAHAARGRLHARGGRGHLPAHLALHLRRPLRHPADAPRGGHRDARGPDGAQAGGRVRVPRRAAEGGCDGAGSRRSSNALAARARLSRTHATPALLADVPDAPAAGRDPDAAERARPASRPRCPARASRPMQELFTGAFDFDPKCTPRGRLAPVRRELRPRRLPRADARRAAPSTASTRARELPDHLPHVLHLLAPDARRAPPRRSRRESVAAGRRTRSSPALDERARAPYRARRCAAVRAAVSGARAPAVDRRRHPCLAPPIDLLLFAVLPYVALVVFFLVTIQRYWNRPFSYSSLLVAVPREPAPLLGPRAVPLRHPDRASRATSSPSWCRAASCCGTASRCGSTSSRSRRLPPACSRWSGWSASSVRRAQRAARSRW